MHGGLYIFLWWYLVTLWTHVPHVPLSLCLCTRIWQLMFFAREPFFASFRLRFYVFWFRKRSLKQNPLEHWSVQDSVHAQPNAFCKIYHHKIKSKHALQLAQILASKMLLSDVGPPRIRDQRCFINMGLSECANHAVGICIQRLQVIYENGGILYSKHHCLIRWQELIWTLLPEFRSNVIRPQSQKIACGIRPETPQIFTETLDEVGFIIAYPVFFSF